MHSRSSLLVYFAVATILAGALLAHDRSFAADESPDKSQAKPDKTIYTVGKYDPARKPADDLAATIKRAKSEQKRIILEVGGSW